MNDWNTRVYGAHRCACQAQMIVSDNGTEFTSNAIMR